MAGLWMGDSPVPCCFTMELGGLGAGSIMLAWLCTALSAMGSGDIGAKSRLSRARLGWPLDRRLASFHL